MKFGKEFRIYLEDSLPEWRDKFLCYKPLKKLLKRFPNNPISVLHFNTQIQHPTQDLNQQINGDSSGCEPSGSGIGNQSGPSERFMSLDEFQDWFVRLLNNELDKLNDFYVEKEEDFIIRFQVLYPFFYLYFFEILFHGLLYLSRNLYIIVVYFLFGFENNVLLTLEFQ